MKNNLARIDGGLAFRIEQHMVGPGNAILASAIVWDSERVTRTADEILAAAEDVGVRSAIDEAVDWLRDLLADSPMAAKDSGQRATLPGTPGRPSRGRNRPP